jgi:hypothetical protein
MNEGGKMKKKRIIFLLVFVIGFILIISLPARSQTRTIRRSETESENLKLMKPTGITQIMPTVNSINIRPGEYLIARVGNTAAKQSMADGKQRFTLPFQVYGISRSGKDLNLELVIEDEGGMRFDQTDNRFEGVLHVGLLDKDSPNSPQQPIPNSIDLLVINEQGGIDPRGDLRITHTNLPFEAVTAHVIAPQEPVRIKIRASFDQEPVSIDLPIIRPRINLKTSRQTIKGWGLETAEINIVVEGFPNPEGKTVLLESTKGGLDSTRLELDNNGTAGTEIRSIGVGEAEITASMANAESDQAIIVFVNPWMFFLIAIIGGLIGSLIKILTDKIGSAKGIIGRLALGILIAIVVAVAFTVGVNLTGIEPKAKVGEAVIFVLAAIGAWAGTFTIPKKSS